MSYLTLFVLFLFSFTTVSFMLPPNVGFTLRSNLVVFRRSAVYNSAAVTPQKVNRSGSISSTLSTLLGVSLGTFWARSVQ